MRRKEPLTAREWRLLGEFHGELIGGRVTLTPPASRAHQTVLRNLFLGIQAALPQGTGEVFFAPFDLHLGTEDIFQPDLMVITDTRMIRDDGVYGAPALVVEVLSQDEGRTLEHKKGVYEAAGVPEFWIVAPAKRWLVQRLLTGGRHVASERLGPGDAVESPLGFRLALNRIFC